MPLTDEQVLAICQEKERARKKEEMDYRRDEQNKKTANLRPVIDLMVATAREKPPENFNIFNDRDTPYVGFLLFSEKPTMLGTRSAYLFLDNSIKVYSFKGDKTEFHYNILLRHLPDNEDVSLGNEQLITELFNAIEKAATEKFGIKKSDYVKAFYSKAIYSKK